MVEVVPPLGVTTHCGSEEDQTGMGVAFRQGVFGTGRPALDVTTKALLVQPVNVGAGRVAPTKSPYRPCISELSESMEPRSGVALGALTMFWASSPGTPFGREQDKAFLDGGDDSGDNGRHDDPYTRGGDCSGGCLGGVDDCLGGLLQLRTRRLAVCPRRLTPSWVVWAKALAA